MASPPPTDFDAVLEKLGLGECIKTLRENGVENWETIKELTERDMKELGIKLDAHLVDIMIDNLIAISHPRSRESHEYSNFLQSHPSLYSAFDRIKSLEIDWKFGRINMADPYQVGHLLGELHATLSTIDDRYDARRVELAVRHFNVINGSGDAQKRSSSYK
ncbi:uncharacterized protein BDZ99DRAFT_517862 [Mytilinidion resinicola]|uniref:SAM domain-containing protein n=1 Tax=Mytilinidion resinicola TaxID=574789 RepID=A0A6A6YXD8_9PEZI|nr:uncharacterized protein BDZ99DRAFT_517862 [Mytilinidion resinicola]KAF2813616.1 hypothetical protein BDZ99DRAFT_517862 [Mytilinidion resinicola]